MAPIGIQRTRPLGALGEVGAIAFGCWRFTHEDVGTARSLIEAALDAGFNLIDTADIYGLGWQGRGFGSVESLLGSVLAADPSLRDRMVVATKGGIIPPTPYDSSPRYLIEACESSLRRLGVDVIDLYQIHRPDLLTHPGEVAETLDKLVASGKVRAVGVSNHTVAQTEALCAHLATPLLTTQPEFSVAELGPLRDGTFDMAMRLGVVPMVWSPLAGGRIVTGEGIRTELSVTLDRIAAAHGATRANIALAFVLAQAPRPIAIIGTQRVERFAEAAAALGIRLEREQMYAIIQASEGAPLP
jgi:aryl-alcohol dehydrogenase-like predicted oxidoreductase